MSRIPEFEQRRLASEAVGTPGVDLSEAQITEAIGQAAADILTVSAEVIQRRQAANDLAEINRSTVSLDASFNEQDKLFKQTVADNPRGKVDEYTEGLTAILNEKIEVTESSSVKRELQKNGLTQIKLRGLAFNKWSSEQEAVLALDKVNSATNILANQAREAGKVGDLNRFLELMIQGQGSIAASKDLLSVEEFSKIEKDAPKSIATGFTFGLMEDNPEILLRLIDEGRLNDFFEPEEINTLRTNAQSSLTKQIEQEDIDRLKDFGNNFVGVWNDIQTGNKPLAEIQILENEEQIDSRTASLLKDMIIKEIPANEKADVQMALWEKQSQIAKDVKKKKTKLNFQEIIDFDNQVLEARNQGFISASIAKNMLGPVREALNISVKQNIGEVGLGFNVFEIATEAVNELKESPTFKTEVLKNFMTLSSDREFSSDFNKKISTDKAKEVRKLIQQATNMVESRENPVLSFLSGTPNVLMKPDGTLRRTFPADKQDTTPTEKELQTNRFLLQKSKTTGKFFVFDKVTGKRREANEDEIKRGNV